MDTEGLFDSGFTKIRLAKELAQADPGGEHWLAAYEFVRQGHGTNRSLSSDPVCADMLRRNVPFYRSSLPRYASFLHPGGAPDWAINAMLAAATHQPIAPQHESVVHSPVIALLEADISRVSAEHRTFNDLVAKLFGDDYKSVIEALEAGPPY